MQSRKVWLVGAGPSDAGLLTLKAKHLIQNAEVILYDSLVGDAILAMIPSGVKLINVGKRAGHAVMKQEDINRTLLQEALSGKNVVRLKGGDPFLFGRGGEELELLAEHQIPFEVVPGVTSAFAVPAYAGIPVTHRDFCSSVHVITGHKKDIDKPEIDFDALVKLQGTLIFLMGLGALEHISESLIKAGMRSDMPAAVLEKGTRAGQRRVVSTLRGITKEVRQQDIKTPAIIIVGEVCSLSEKFHWAEDRPLGGARVLVTRPKKLASKLSGRLRELGAEVVEIPAIETVEIENNTKLDDALGRIREYSWLVFTSQAGVEIFFSRLMANKKDIRLLNGVKIAAIGSATEKALHERGLFAHCVPETYDSVHLGKALTESVKAEERLLIPRAKIGSKELTEQLDRHGILYDEIPVYDTVYEKSGLLQLDEMLKEPVETYVAFTSASTVRGFADMAGTADCSQIKAVCIGEQTAAEAVKHGFETIISDEITIDSLAAKIVQLHAAQNPQ